MVDGDFVTTQNFATVKPDQVPSGDEINVRITPVLSGFSKQDGIFDYKAGDSFKIKTLGIEDDTLNLKTGCTTTQLSIQSVILN